MRLASFFASAMSVTSPSVPGTTGTPAAIMVAFAVALSPMASICSGWRR
jgi:hypothetical protein